MVDAPDMERVERLDISAEHAAYAGHFPGSPMLPGVVLLDAVLHAVAPPGPWRIETAKFFAAVRPGDPLQLAYACPSATRLRFEIRGADGGTLACGTMSRADGT
jgi:3-hydroxymyristoyl/3-hydroxydecanoyl-(acyl carrier protein) dehydratase